MLKKIAYAVLALLVLLLIAAATRPDQFSVQRSARIQAAPEKIFPLLVDFRRFGEWSPWEKLDAGMKRNFSGPASGPGAVYAWDGNDSVGAGRMEILSAEPHTLVAIQLDFLRPMEGHNRTEYRLRPLDGGTEVTWTMSGPMPFLSKLMSLFFSMDAMIGPDFEAGLRNLRAVAEKP